jgi:diguanylate cyclase (GGDEF)-like protein/PAS domain S-box-containing protein
MPVKKKAGAKKTTKQAFWSASPLADATESLVCDCQGGVIAALNGAGRKLLGSKAKPGTHLAACFADGNGKPLKSLTALTAGRQPKPLTLLDGKGRRVPVDVTAKALGGAGAKARVLVVAHPAKPRQASKPARAPARAKSLGASSSLTAQILGAASNGIIAVDTQGIITLANPAAADLLNRDAAAMQGVSIERVFVFGSGHSDAGTAIPLKAQFKNGPYYIDHDVHLARSDGQSFEAVYVVVPVIEARRTVGYVITFRDITQRRRAEAEMRLAAVVFDHSPEGVVVADAKGRVTKVNPAYKRIAGNDNADVIGKQLSDILFAESKAPSSVLDILQGSDQTQWEQWCKSSSGRRYAARISVSVVREHSGSIQQYVAIIADVTRRKLDEEKIIYQANYDQLTNLPNRTLFMDRLTRMVLEGRRAKTSIGLMFIDLDGFKNINDTLGHDAGDELLVSTARRLEKCVREADTVARLGGDEFTVIMPLIDNFDAAGFVAGRIIKSLTEPFDLGGREGKVSASIGISLLPAQASTAGELLHNADVAMYHAKRQGKANYQFYRPELEETVKVKDREI